MMQKEPSSNMGEPVAFVVFGVTGDLTRRKLIPALYELKLAGRLDVPLYIIGFARRDWSDDFLRDTLRTGVQEFARSQPVDLPVLESLLANAHYIQSTFDDMDGYHRLSALLGDLKINNVMFYLATPPNLTWRLFAISGRHIVQKNVKDGPGLWSKNHMVRI